MCKVSESSRKIFKSMFLQNKQLDTFAVDHLLSKFNSDTCKVYACMSPVDHVGLPYFDNYVRPNDGKQLLCILLCDGVHFQGYIVDINRYKIIHIDSLLSNNSNNRTSQKIAQNLFESETNVQYESLFPTRRQFDSNSCGVWLVAGNCKLCIKPTNSITEAGSI